MNTLPHGNPEEQIIFDDVDTRECIPERARNSLTSLGGAKQSGRSSVESFLGFFYFRNRTKRLEQRPRHRQNYGKFCSIHTRVYGRYYRRSDS